MPQLDGTVYITQAFWLLVTFLSFWLIMAKLIVPRISEVIEARKRKYDDYIRKAEEINKQALLTLERYEEMLAVAKANASEQISQNEKDLKTMIADKETEINQQLKEKISEQEALLESERQKTLAKVKEISQNTAFDILQKLNLNIISREELSQTYLNEDN